MLRTPTCEESYDMTPCTGECQLNEEETLFDDLESERLEERGKKGRAPRNFKLVTKSTSVKLVINGLIKIKIT